MGRSRSRPFSRSFARFAANQLTPYPAMGRTSGCPNEMARRCYRRAIRLPLRSERQSDHGVRRNILVHPKEIRRIELPLDLDELVVLVGAERRANAIG